MKDLQKNTGRRKGVGWGGIGGGGEQDMQNITFVHEYNQEMTTALLQVVL